MKQIQIFTDGSCIGNPGPGGWAAYLVFGEHKKLISGSHPETTNNRMELLAIVESLRALKCPCQIVLTTDSDYCRKVICGSGTQPKTTIGKKTRKNLDLVLLAQQECTKHRVRFQWVRGHNGHPENELVDSEANRQARSLHTLQPNH